MSDELVLTDNEFGLFELMRDGVITNLVKVSHKPDLWRCTTSVANERTITEFESKLSALDAFMKARIHIFTMKLEGREVYTFSARQKRKELGLA